MPAGQKEGEGRERVRGREREGGREKGREGGRGGRGGREEMERGLPTHTHLDIGDVMRGQLHHCKVSLANDLVKLVETNVGMSSMCRHLEGEGGREGGREGEREGVTLVE